MAGFTLYSSNNQRRLLSELARKIKTLPLPDPLETEKIVVHSYGMQRWMSMELAMEIDILANTDFLFPNELLTAAFQSVVEDFDAAKVSERERMTWRLLSLFFDSQELSRFSDLSVYLESADEYKLYQLSRRLAGLMDQYCMFRPDWILKWEAGEIENWQAGVWNLLQKRFGGKYKPHFQREFREKVEKANVEKFARRISLFGISSLPPIHIELLYHLSRFIDVDVYFLNPSRQYWADILSKKEISRIRQRRPEVEDLLDEGNSLFASTAKTGKEFYFQLIDNDLVDDHGEDRFIAPDNPSSLLELIKADIYELRALEGQKGISPSDRSIQIHNCHSPMREVEVLYDQILQLLSADPALEPDDIVVMCPDIEDYSAFIKAVFAAGERDVSPMPFSIADRSLKNESKTIEFFFKLLETIKGRVPVADVMELFEFEPLRARFNLTEPEVEHIQRWITGANIRWGIDASFRETYDMPPTYETTSEFGIDRLLTGFALPLQEEGFLKLDDSKSILPYDDIEGIDAFSLGKFLEFFNCFKNAALEGPFRGEHRFSLESWAENLKNLVNQFFKFAADWDVELNALIETLDELVYLSPESKSPCEIQFETVFAHLKSRLLEKRSNLGFLGSGVTFCAMLPMRSIPFKVIMLLGMNDRVFPRISAPLSFDLMADKRRIGDRSIKDEDRYIFLEAILSAEKTLYISYVGQSIKDNSSIPPSVLVSELKYYIEKGYRLEGGGNEEKNKILEHVQTDHPLQAFNAKYFDAGQKKLFSFSGANLAAAQQRGRDKEPQGPFLSELPAIEEISLSVEEFAGFFSNPCRYLLRNRLELFLDSEMETQIDQEAFGLDSLNRYLLQTEALKTAFRESDAEFLKRKYRAKGLLPLGEAGNLHFDDAYEETIELLEDLKKHVSVAEVESVSYEIEIDGVMLRGDLEGICRNRLIRLRPAKLRARDRLNIWIEQLILQIAIRESASSILVMKDPQSSVKLRKSTIFSTDEIPDPEGHLRILVQYFKKGLSKPLPFFPETALAYLEALQKDQTKERAKNQTSMAWLGDGERRQGESTNPYINRCFRHLDLFQTGFERVGRDILGPVINAQVKQS